MVYMATVASSHKLFYTDNNLLVAKGKREHVPYNEASVLLRKHKDFHLPVVNMTPQKGKHCTVIKVLSSTEKHLKSLESYLKKIHDDAKQPSLKILNQRIESVGKNDQLKADNDADSENYVNEDLQASINTSARKDEGNGMEKLLRNYTELKTEDVESNQKPADNSSDFYLIGVLASINIAVFLFELATPVKNSNFELFSLPLLYGAKINDLILTGEWWRLVTPMFLHSGIFHMALGSWVLFTFGIKVSQEYGSFTFLLIYVLGGISGNFISFLHTPEPTVGGTGPVFAVIGAWLIYQVQNKDVIARDASERMMQRAIIVTALSFVLSNFGPIDDWAHFASAFTGVAYGFVTCPTLQVKDAAGRQERITLVRRYADPCKSLMYFSLFILLLSSLLFIIEPPLDLIE
ncbi:hypothetical protein BUALT_Bualt04G0079500 [Buddleja alternifolia]|uniref:Peptidase S54 rhomboid domain-containing protein n=1 Tax=Buddleja alternifolia TaxID=168488 RepID=A0AAV6XV96_9LAMI|nr:hypothetical protein BUALT_Bualt04G0079500 [Buddleja alternifolia]